MYSHRTFLELSVGTTHTAEVVVHLRRSDLPWFNASPAEHQAQLFSLIGRRILPAVCGEEVDADLAAWRAKRAKIGVLIGEKNLAGPGPAAAASSAAAIATTGESKRGGRGKGKGKGKGKTKKGKKAKSAASKKKGGNNKKGGGKISTKTTLAALAGGGGGRHVGKKRKRDAFSEVTYLFADSLQVTYRVEDVSVSDSVTLLYNDKKDKGVGGAGSKQSTAPVKNKTKGAAAPIKAKNPKGANSNRGLASFRQLKKLSKRIVLWVYPFDPDNPSAPSTGEGGFPRPEMIPLSSLFVEREEGK